MGMLFLSAVLEGLLFLVMPQAKFDAKYNGLTSQLALPKADAANLKIEGVNYYQSGDYDLAMEAFKEALEANAADPGIHFNLACTYSNTYQLSLAIYHLELALSYGLPKPERLENHPGLAWLRQQPAYLQFRANNYRQQLLAPSQLAAATDVTTDELLKNEPKAQTPDLLEQLRLLGELRNQGVLSEAEFAQQKQKIVAVAPR